MNVVETHGLRHSAYTSENRTRVGGTARRGWKTKSDDRLASGSDARVRRRIEKPGRGEVAPTPLEPASARAYHRRGACRHVSDPRSGGPGGREVSARVRPGALLWQGGTTNHQDQDPTGGSTPGMYICFAWTGRAADRGGAVPGVGDELGVEGDRRAVDHPSRSWRPGGVEQGSEPCVPMRPSRAE